MPQLRYIDDAGTLKTVTLGLQPLLIGRVSTCEICFIDDMISREHTRLEREADGRYRIRDLGSRNKTHVNGEQVAETLLFSGDVIRVGNHVIEYVSDDGAQAKMAEDFLTPDTNEPANCEWFKLKAPTSLTLQQIEQLSGLSAHWGLTSRPEDIADICLSQILVALQAERGFIAVRGEEKHALKPIATRGLKRSLTGALTPVSQSFAVAPILQKVAGRYPQAAKNIVTNAGYAAVAIAAPLTFRGSPIGVVYLDRPTSGKPFTSEGVQYLLAAGAAVGASMAAASKRLSETVGLQEAAWISSINRMHEALHSAPVGNDTFSVGYRLFPGSQRRGDFCDVLTLNEQRCLIVMVDAGGQGHSGLAQAMAIRGAMHAAAATHPDEIDLGAMFTALNTMIAGHSGRKLVACLAIICDVASGSLTYINAGAPPPVVLVGPGRLLTLDQPSLLLGIDSSFLYETTSVELPPRFRLVCYTDGVGDAVNGANEVFGDRGVHELLLDRVAFGPVVEIITRLSEAHVSLVAGTDDDATFLAVGRS
jgi:pSer/pThr/pTyr-binding forkhead associated (FHA) protein